MSSTMFEEDCVKDTLINCLNQQISEIELLQSMYPDEIILPDKKTLEDMYNFVEGKSENTPNHLDFNVKLLMNGLKLEVCINLPSFYPTEEPDIYVRCNQLNRHQETALNSQLVNYIQSNYLGEVCLYTAISWLQENIEFVIESSSTDKVNNVDKALDNSTEIKFVRYWIYSHHIYNKKKREEIVKLAKELKLTGFCLPGKPGIICIEGISSDCLEWWRDIKSMTWKKIMVRKKEEFSLADQAKHQKFSKFQELHFQNPTTKNNKHADMSGFSKFMEQQGLTQEFNQFFGLCNESNIL